MRTSPLRTHSLDSFIQFCASLDIRSSSTLCDFGATQVVALGFLASVYIVMYTEVVNARAFYDFHAASYGTANFFLPARVRITEDHKRDPAMAHTHPLHSSFHGSLFSRTLHHLCSFLTLVCGCCWAWMHAILRSHQIAVSQIGCCQRITLEH